MQLYSKDVMAADRLTSCQYLKSCIVSHVLSSGGGRRRGGWAFCPKGCGGWGILLLSLCGMAYLTHPHFSFLCYLRCVLLSVAVWEETTSLITSPEESGYNTLWKQFLFIGFIYHGGAWQRMETLPLTSAFLLPYMIVCYTYGSGAFYSFYSNWCHTAVTSRRHT